MTIALLYFMRLSTSQRCIAHIELLGSSGSNWKLQWRWDSGFVGELIWVGLTDGHMSWITFRGTGTAISGMVLHPVGGQRFSPPRIFVSEMISCRRRHIGLG